MISRRSMLISSLAIALAGCDRTGLTSDLKKLRFGMLPYGDHTQAIIGIEKGWFREVGIELEANVIKIEQVVPFLKSGQYDVVSTPPGVLIAGFNEAPNLVMATFGDLFQGYALIARPDKGYKSYAEFVEQGAAPPMALKLAAEQLRGSRFAYPPEGGIRPFIDLLLETGELTVSSLDPIVVDDPVGVAAMRRGDADFHVGGVPARMALQKAGYKPIISAGDFARIAKPSRTSKELQAVLPGGWAVRRELYEDDPDLIVRLASVSYRINDLINSSFEEAATIHMRYLSQATGQPFDLSDARIIYDDLDPFLTFEQQERWFEDSSYPLYFEHLIGAHIDSYVEDEAFSGAPPTVESLIVADDVYRRLKELRNQCDSLSQSASAEYDRRDYLSCSQSQ